MLRALRRLLPLSLISLLLGPAAALARDVTASPAHDVSVTIYRSAERDDGDLDLSELGGFAVITEKRMIHLPAGTSRLRFEGVADQMIAESAIITGLPGRGIEKNRDAALLSASALLRASLNKMVELRRTDDRSGKVARIPARIRSATGDGIMLETAGGLMALRCSGAPETVTFERAANGLSATPTLSVATRTGRPLTATVTLTYIAQGFDWTANYTGYVSPDGKSMDIGAWITLANGNSISLRNARTLIVAGGVRREDQNPSANAQPQVMARCWPMQSSSEVPLKPDQPYHLVQPDMEGDYERWSADGSPRISSDMLVYPMPPPPPPPSAPPPVPVPEQLGDLKLYRIAEPTTIAARQMKQTRLLDQAGVPIERLYTIRLNGSWRRATPQRLEVSMSIRTANDKAHQLGIPLPKGMMLIEQNQLGRIMMISQSELSDRAEGDEVELGLGAASDVTAIQNVLAPPPASRPGVGPSPLQSVEVSNTGDTPASVELWLGSEVTPTSLPVETKNGERLVRFSVPAKDKVTMQYSVN